MQFIPLDQTGVFGGPNITPCNGCTATEPAPLTAAVVPVGDTHSVIDADGLNTYKPARCKLIVATLTLELLTVDGASAFGDGYVVLPVPIRLVFHLSCRYLAYRTPQQSVSNRPAVGRHIVLQIAARTGAVVSGHPDREGENEGFHWPTTVKFVPL